MSYKVLKLDYHRNGICGQGFHVGLIEDTSDGPPRRMVSIRLNDDADKAIGAVACFVLDVDKLAEGVIEFGENSWRGDWYADVMDEAIKQRHNQTT